MTKENIKDLKRIIKNIREGTYTLLGPADWDNYTEILSRSGADLLRDIEKERSQIHPIRIHFIYLRSKKTMDNLDKSHHALLGNYDLFFDASMRFLKCFSEGGDQTATKRIYAKQYVKGLLDHSSQAIGYITNLVLKKSTEYKHCQTLFVALGALIIALFSLVGLRFIGYALLVAGPLALGWYHIRNNNVSGSS
ncbi:MAG: hypothetical protein DRP85_03015 [Candidatus Makaraimicrobium thalassicum]|nr:MAG: hypothetical protein DRP85_03015 [Candidatus Omnitrophota bacterium]